MKKRKFRKAALEVLACAVMASFLMCCALSASAAEEKLMETKTVKGGATEIARETRTESPVYCTCEHTSEPQTVEEEPLELTLNAVEEVAETHEEAPEPTYTAEELEAMALVIYQEAGADYCSDETRMMVGTVVMNRVADSRFPDTIHGVLTQKAQYGRLHWTGLVWPERASKAVEAHAVERAYKCAERILNGERALPEGVVFQSEFVQGTEIVAFRDGMYFCR